MKILDVLRETIGKVGIKETARRAKIAPSTVSRIFSGQINPGLDVAERLSEVLGFQLQLQSKLIKIEAPRLELAATTLRNSENSLKSLGVKHAIIFGSVARKEDGTHSDIDIYLDFGGEKPKAQKLLRAEGLVFEIFGENKVDVVSLLNSSKNSKLKQQIEMDGVLVF